MESFSDQARAFALALGIHLVLIGLIWLSAIWILPQRQSSTAGEPVRASLQVSAADIRRAKAAIKASPKPVKPAKASVSAPPQPLPAPRPQASDVPLQMTAQAPQDRPDTVDQQRISRLAQEQADHTALAEQEERRRQEQVDLTEAVKRQQEVERKQRLREQLEAVTREREAATKRTRLEEQRLQQLEDMQTAAPASATRTPNPPPPGNRGIDEGLLARYKAAMNQTAHENWNPIGAPALVHCKVRFRQIVGGIVTSVEFINCPYDAEGREFVERALLKSPMPYSGFETVYSKSVELDFCYPLEECE